MRIYKSQSGFASLLGLLIMTAAAIIVVVVWKAGQTNKSSNSHSITYASQADCEQKTGKVCTFQNCDYVPPGKTFDEVCGKDFKKGWVTATPQKNLKTAAVSFRTISSGGGGFNNIEFKASSRVINNNDEWEKFWHDYRPQGSSEVNAPKIDFNTKSVIAVVMGPRGSGGYSIKVDKIESVSGRLRIKIISESPGKSCTSVTVMTSPYHIIEIDKTDSTTEFVTQKVINEC